MMTWKLDDHAAEGPVIVLSGFIDEEADFTPVAKLDGLETLRLDLAGVVQINSCGVREWIHFVRDVSLSARPLELLRCPPAIVRQINMVSNFRGGAEVRSVLLPYFCAGCEREELRLLELPESGSPPPIEASVRCEKCGGASEFDDVPARYLAFATET